MIGLLYQWIDLLWLPVAMVVTHPGQRLKSALFILCCILTLRTQVEIMESIGKPTGILDIVQSGLYERGLVVYGLLIGLFLILAYLSPRTKGAIFLAAVLSLYILGFCVSMIVMLL